jgi:hypothetical protein
MAPINVKNRYNEVINLAIESARRDMFSGAAYVTLHEGDSRSAG